MKALVTNAADDTGLVAVRSLAASGFDVVGVDTHRLPPGGRSRYASSYHRLAHSEQPDLEQELLRLVERIRPDVFLPLGTYGVRAAARHRDALEAITAVNVVDRPAFEAAFDKAACMAECRLLGIPTPAAYSREDALDAVRNGAGQVVVKPRWDAGAATDVRYVRDADALTAAIRACRQRHGGYVIQELVPGGVETMKTVLLLFSRESRLAAAFTTQKIRQWPQTGGPTAVSRSTAENDLVELVLPFFEKWRWRGPAEVELKLDTRDGQHKAIEINPRFPGYLRFPWHCGLDLPLLSARLALGDAAVGADGLPAYRVGATWLAPTLFLQTLREDVRTHGLGSALRRARADARGSAPVVLGTFADPLPLLVRMLRPKGSPSSRISRPQATGPESP